MPHCRYLRVASLAVCTLWGPGFAGPVRAQAQDDAESQPLHSLETIVVTATRRDQPLQQTPIAVTAFTDADLARSQIDGARELQFYTPGLQIVDYGVPQIFIRGIGSNTFGAATDPSATIHLDGVYIARTYPAFFDFVDVARVEVLRGPQGTLYGRNSTAGTINIISQGATDSLTGNADLLYGAYDRVRARATVSGPVAGEALLGRLSVSYNRRDGIYDNVIDGRKVDDQDTLSFRGALTWHADDEFFLTLRGDYARQRQTGGVSKILSTDPALTAAGAIFPADHYRVALDTSPFFDVDNYGTTLEAVWSPGAVTVKSITAYRKFRSNNLFDTDGMNLPIAKASSNEESGTFTQELQALSPSDQPFEWLVGAYFLKDDAKNFGGTLVNPTGSVILDPALIPAQGVLSNFDPRTFLAGFPGGGAGTHDNTTEAYALYADLTYHMTPRLSLVVGARYSYESKDTTVDLGFGATSAKDNWHSTTPRVVLQYAATDSAFLYATVSEGFKSGGFNPFETAAYKPEYVTNYEVGAKFSAFDGRLETNLAAFHAIYRDFQVQSLGPLLTTVVLNAGRATTQGIEAEVFATPLPGLQLGASVAYLDATYDVFSLTSIAAYAPVQFPPYGTYNYPLLAEYDQAGTSMFNAPKWSVSFTANYSMRVTDTSDLTLRVEDLYSDQARTDRTFTRPSYDLVNLSATFGPRDGKWSVMAFGKNVFDKHYLSYGAVQPPLWGNVTNTVQGEPATWGLQISLRY